MPRSSNLTPVRRFSEFTTQQQEDQDLIKTKLALLGTPRIGLSVCHTLLVFLYLASAREIAACWSLI